MASGRVGVLNHQSIEKYLIVQQGNNMKVKNAVALVTTALAMNGAHAHTSFSEGAMHIVEHVWLVLLPLVMWFLWSVLKSQSKASKSTGDGRCGE